MSITGKSLSEALIFAPTNPQYDDRLFIELKFSFDEKAAKIWFYLPLDLMFTK